jgi:hypothetical protein
MRCRKKIKLILIISFLLITAYVKAGEPLYWLTYAHSKYIGSPGIEACYHFHPHLGVNLGLGIYIQNPDQESLTSITHHASFGFYCANVGVSTYFFKSENHSAGLIAGLKLYYGPDYRKFRYYEEGGYYIYFDASFLQPDYGLDLGIFYNYKKFTLLSKWDFARNRFRIGIGYRFKS